jgi:hypothetical protein
VPKFENKKTAPLCAVFFMVGCWLEIITAIMAINQRMRLKSKSLPFRERILKKLPP